MALCFLLSLQIGSGKNCFKKACTGGLCHTRVCLEGITTASLGRRWLGWNSESSGGSFLHFFSLDVTWPRDATLLVLGADWKKDAASLKIEA